MKTMNLKKVSTLLIAIFVTSLAFQSCDGSNPLTQSELEGYWVLKSMNGREATTEFSGALPTLQFNFEDNTISGTGGCNRYSGAFTYKDGVFAAPNLAVTRMLCIKDNNEGQFLKELTGIDNKLSITDGLLIVTRNKEAIFEFEKGATTADTTAVAPQILK